MSVISEKSTASTDGGTDEDDVAERAGQAGLAARGFMYLVSAVLTLRIALGSGSGGEGPGKQGALRSVAQQPFGRVIVVVLAVGFAGYAVWRFISAWTYECDDDESDAKGWAKRLGYVFRGGVYLVALASAVSLVLGDSSGGGSGSGGSGSGGSGAGGSGAGQQSTARVFDLPMGRWIVLAVGVGVLAAAAYNGYRALNRSYREKWEDDMSAGERRWAGAISWAGLIGHMLVFALIGFFLVKAAVEYDPNEPKGLDEAVRALADATLGTVMLVILAAGMLAYSAFSFVEARWRALGE